jgi:DNA topoisomerase-2
MSAKDEPVIETACDCVDYTRITFFPDLTKFKMSHMDADTVALLKKRAYDLAGVSAARVRVLLNGKRIEIKNFSEYCDLYLKGDETKDLPKISEKSHDRWEIIASLSDGQFQQVSFVNSICTSKGGTHVNYIAD